MRVPFDFVNNYLDLSINLKYEESSELLESFFLSNVECNEIEINHEYNLDFFMIYGQTTEVYFNRMRNILTKIINFPLKIPKFTDTCGNLLYSLITFTNKLINSVNVLEANHNDVEYDENYLFQYKDVLYQLRLSILLLGNWKNLPSNLLDAKCTYKEKSNIENVYTVAIHTILSTQNILFYLVHFLTQKILSNKQLFLTFNYEICAFAEDDLNEDELSFFIQHSYLVVNNLVHLNFNAFKKNINYKDSNTELTNTIPCECVAKSWYLSYYLMQTYDKNGHLSRIQHIFWTALNRIVNCFKKSKKQVETFIKNLSSNKIYFQQEEKLDEINHFILLLNNDISICINQINGSNENIQASDYLDSSYQLLKNTVKDILDHNQGTGQMYYLKLKTPLQIACTKLHGLSDMLTQNTMDTSGKNSSVCQKILVDIMILFWESYFSKYMNSSFIIWKNDSSSSNLADNLTQSHEFKAMFQTIEGQICSSHDNNISSKQTDQSKAFNIFHIFLKYLYLNLKESSQLSPNGSTTSAVWRTFKGRLYTRLHDKRISELDLSGIVNLAYIFYTLIKSFSSTSLAMSQLRFDQMENFFRIVNVFVKSKNLDKIESLMSNQASNDKIQAKTNTLRTIMNVRFTALRLWFQTNELSNESNKFTNNEEEVKQIISNDFSDIINNWLTEAMNILKINPTGQSGVDLKLGNQSLINPNQINNYKNAQIINQFLSDMVLNYIENCRQFLLRADGSSQSFEILPIIHILTIISCELLNQLQIERLFKILSRKQFEVVCSKLSEIIVMYKKLIQNELSEFANNSKLSNHLTDFTMKLWNVLIESQLSSTHSPTVFSYEIISGCYFEMCSFYSHLFFNPESLLVNSTKKMKTLIDMIEQICFPNQADATVHSTIVRLKVLNQIFKDQSLFELCKRNMGNFETRLVGFLIYAYINNSSVADNSSINAQSNKLNSNGSIVDFELNIIMENSITKITAFNELCLKNSSNLENLINDFIKGYAIRLKKTESFADRKVEIEKFSVYFQDFLKLINSLQSITSHAIIYKCYLIASQIIFHLSIYLHGRGRSDTIFAKIIDKMILPYALTKNSNTKSNSGNNVIQSNNLNSISISLKDTLHLFLSGINPLNYEYDGYLKRVCQNICTNFTMKFQMVQFDDHFLTLTLEGSFTEVPTDEIIRFRCFIFKALKQAFCIDLKPTVDTEKYLSLLNYFLSRTKSIKVIAEEAKISLTSILLLLGNETNSLKSKALQIFTIFMKKSNGQDQTENQSFTDSIENLLKTYWHQVEPGKIFVSLCSIARQNKTLITPGIKYLILQKIEETPSKFRFNVELKNTLFTLYELIDGDQGKIYLNTHLAHILN